MCGQRAIKAVVSVGDPGALPSVRCSVDIQQRHLGLTPDHTHILSCSPTHRGFHGRMFSVVTLLSFATLTMEVVFSSERVVPSY